MKIYLDKYNYKNRITVFITKEIKINTFLKFENNEKSTFPSLGEALLITIKI